MTTAAPSTTAPPRDLQQRLDALKRANEIRSLRSALKRDIQSQPGEEGRDQVARMLTEPTPPALQTMKVLDLLTACRGLGKVKVNSALRRTETSPSKTLGGLTTRQRNALADHLDRP